MIKCKKNIDPTPFDRDRIPPRQNLFFMPFVWGISYIATRGSGLKIHKERMKGLKPPYLLLGTHHSFMDFGVTPLAVFPHRANYISELEGFENYGEWLYRQAGCLGTRKFVDDLALIKNMKRVTDRGDIMVLYPEARYANVGTSSQIPDSVGKLAKLLKVPVVTLNMHGNYLQSPIWNLTKRKEARLEATITQLFTKDEVQKASAKEIVTKVREALHYDEYEWQYQKKMKITYKDRAKGLHLPLYQCPVCKTEHRMNSKGSELYCEQCGSRWEMTEYGRMKLIKGGETGFSDIHIPDWYEWERKNVENSLKEHTYRLDCKVHIYALPNAKNFIDLNEGRLTHDASGYTLTFTDYGESEEKTMEFKAKSMISVHTEYDYRGLGQCITLSTLDNTYFLFPVEKDCGFNATKIQFATESI